MIPKISLFDLNFAHHGPKESLASFPGFSRFPKTIEWDRENVHDICVFTDNQLDRAKEITCKKKIAWLLEPRELSDFPYCYVKNNIDVFDIVYSHDIQFLNEIGDKGKYFLYGGTWIQDSDHCIFPKSKDISIIASWKNQLPGHKLRHEVIKEFKDKYSIDVFGNGYNKVENKITALKDYKISIVIENVNDGILSEKLLDCFLCGTIPIYWGSEIIHDYFNADGFTQFRNLSELEEILNIMANPNLFNYDAALPYIKQNFEIAKKLYLTEDSISWT